MKEFEIVVAVFPQSDGTLKRRPALILREMPPFRDFLICGISTQLRQEVKGFDEIFPKRTQISQPADWIPNRLFDSAFTGFAPTANHRLNR